MTVAFYADISPLSNPTIFDAHFKSLPDFRKDKINRLKYNKSKALSLGAWIVLKRALNEFNCRIEDAGFSYLQNGKPYLAKHPELHISISHSESIAMCAVSDFEVGADVECVSQFKEGVCRRFFTKNECDYVLFPKEKPIQTERFFRIWTLKESYAKLTGKGIGDFRNFEINLSGNHPTIHSECKTGSAFFAEPDIPLYKASICLDADDKIRFERINIIRGLLV